MSRTDKHSSQRPYGRRCSKLWRKQNCRRGGLVMETALILPLVLGLIWFMLSAGLTVRHELAIRHALDQVGREMSLLIPIAESLYMELKDSAIDRLIERIIPGEREELRQALTDLGSSIFLQRFLQRRLDRWLDQYAHEFQVRIPPDERRIVLDTWDRHALSMRLDYHIATPWTRTPRQCSTLVPLWTRFEQNGGNTDGEGQEQNEDNIWSADNFTRGRYFRARCGANLPFNYPVISLFSGGRATAIRSIDLTAPSYQDEHNLLRQINFELERMDAFTGSRMETGIDPPLIEKGMIRSKELVLIVPRNSHYHSGSACFAQSYVLAQEKGIFLHFEMVGESRRYEVREDVPGAEFVE